MWQLLQNSQCSSKHENQSWGLGNDELLIEIPGVSCLTFFVELWSRLCENKGDSHTASTCKDAHAPFDAVSGPFEWLCVVQLCMCECKQAMMGTRGVVSFSVVMR